MNHKSDGATNCNRCTWYSHQMIGNGTGGIGNNSTSGDHLNYSILKTSQNTEKSPGDFRRHEVPLTPVKDYQLTQEHKKIIRTNEFRVKINKRQRNRQCRLCGERDEMANHIISE